MESVCLKILCFGFSIFEQFDLNHVFLFALRKMKINEKEKKVESLTISGKFQACIIQAFVTAAISGVVDGSTQTDPGSLSPSFLAGDKLPVHWQVTGPSPARVIPSFR